MARKLPSMRSAILFALLLITAFSPRALAADATPAVCAKFKLDPLASRPLGVATPQPHACKPRVADNGMLLPDPTCTPGAVNPTVTLAVLQEQGFTTKCLRDDATSAAVKAHTYAWYGIPHPKDNAGASQTCELDHLISIELGGADTLDNIWPQCGPSSAVLDARYFKQKDRVENYLAREVKAGRIPLEAAQRGIASDWTQYLKDSLK